MPNHVNAICIQGFCLNDEAVVNEYVNSKFFNELDSLVADWNGNFRLCLMASQFQFASKAFLVNRLGESNAKMPLHFLGGINYIFRGRFGLWQKIVHNYIGDVPH